MPRGGARPGAGRKKAPQTLTIAQQRREALKLFNAQLEDLDPQAMLRPEEILLRVSNGLRRPDGSEWSAQQIRAAEVLVPYSIAKPASVSIHHVTRTDARTYTDEELERIASTGKSSSGTFAASESPLLSLEMVRGGVGASEDEACEASSADH